MTWLWFLFTIFVILLILFATSRIIIWFRESRIDRHLERAIEDPQGIVGHLRIQGVTRRYYLHLPPNICDRPLALVLAFHGGRGNGRRFARQTDFNRLADKEVFAIVYPDAVGLWNDGRREIESDIDDLAFVDALLNHLVRQHSINRVRIYAVGASNGGMFTMRLACEMVDKFAAFVTALAVLPKDLECACKPKRPVSLMMINADSDPLIPWDGGEIRRYHHAMVGGEILSVEQTLQFWSRVNGFDLSLHPITPKLHCTHEAVQITSYGKHNVNNSLTLVRIEGAGHHWPGARLAAVDPDITGPVVKGLEVTSLIWQFCRNQSLV